MQRRYYGSVRKLPSGRFQVRYQAPDGTRRNARGTFVTKGEATRWLARTEADMDRGLWLDPTAGAVCLREYADAWLAQRTVRGRPLAPKTVETYRHSLDAHILPTLGGLKLTDLTTPGIRTWHADILTRVGPTAARQCYSTLRAILNSAVADDVLHRNPCRVTGAGQSRSPERPLLDIDTVHQTITAMPAHLQTLTLVAFWAHLRLGEVIALQRRDIDLKAGALHVQRQLIDLKTGPVLAEPKAASRRTVHLPTQALAALRQHLQEHPGLPSAPLFTRRNGQLLQTTHVDSAWSRARRKVGIEGVHFHDLRHAGLTLSAQLGATTAEVMRRAGHSSTRAAAIYQHAAQGRDRTIADLMSQLSSPVDHTREA